VPFAIKLCAFSEDVGVRFALIERLPSSRTFSPRDFWRLPTTRGRTAKAMGCHVMDFVTCIVDRLCITSAAKHLPVAHRLATCNVGCIPRSAITYALGSRIIRAIALKVCRAKRILKGRGRASQL